MRLVTQIVGAFLNGSQMAQTQKTRYVSAMIAVALAVNSAPVSAQLFRTPKFKIEQSDDRFSTTGLTSYSGMWNRISKRSVAGGIHIDSGGVFVEPVVIRNKADGAVVAISFFVHNDLRYDTSGTSGLLSLGQLQRITFLTGEGGPIALPIERAASKWGDVTSYDAVTRTASTSLTETGFAPVTREQYQRIMNAPTLIAKIDGSRRSVIFEAKHVLKSFQHNLRNFWNGYINQVAN